jgi:hypothetical protein
VELHKEYVVGHTSADNPIIFKKTSLEPRIDRYYLIWETSGTRTKSFSRKFECLSHMNYNLRLGLTQDQIDQMKGLEEDDFLQSLREACKKINSELWYQIPTEDDSKKKICNLCKHYSLLNQFCEKDRLPKKKDDTCSHWEE